MLVKSIKLKSSLYNLLVKKQSVDPSTFTVEDYFFLALNQNNDCKIYQIYNIYSLINN